MNDTLKVAGRIGAELGAAKTENEKLRKALKRIIDRCEAFVDDEAEMRTPSVEVLMGIAEDAIYTVHEADVALSQQPEPTDTYTAVDMATAAAQGFRDGQAAVEQAPAQDERKTFEAWAKTQGDRWLIVGGLQWSAGTDDYASARTNAAWAAWQERAARPAQTEQSGWISVGDRLPDPDQHDRVLIFTDGYDFAGEQYFDVKAESLNEHSFGDPDDQPEPYCKATHWMPLPTMPVLERIG